MAIEPDNTGDQQEGDAAKKADTKKELHTDYPLSEKDEVKKAEKKTQESAKKNK